LITEENVSVVIQVNGKLRDKIIVRVGTLENEVRALALKSEKVAKWIEGGNIKNIVFLPDKLMNIVTK
jgi:leucyl-tRNA synthetase